MSLQFSTGYRNRVAAAALGMAAPSETVMNGCVLMLYSGSRPADADMELGSATLLGTYSIDNAGYALEWGEPENGSISKPGADVWSATAVASGTPTFFRYQRPNDDGTTSNTAVRIQGKVGLVSDPGADLALSSLAVVAGAVLTIDAATATVPATM